MSQKLEPVVSQLNKSLLSKNNNSSINEIKKMKYKEYIKEKNKIVGTITYNVLESRIENIDPLTPIPIISRKLLTSNQEKTFFLEAEKNAVSLRRWEYGNNLNSKKVVTSYSIERFDDSRSQSFINNSKSKSIKNLNLKEEQSDYEMNYYEDTIKSNKINRISKISYITQNVNRKKNEDNNENKSFKYEKHKKKSINQVNELNPIIKNTHYSYLIRAQTKSKPSRMDIFNQKVTESQIKKSRDLIENFRRKNMNLNMENEKKEKYTNDACNDERKIGKEKEKIKFEERDIDNSQLRVETKENQEKRLKPSKKKLKLQKIVKIQRKWRKYLLIKGLASQYIQANYRGYVYRKKFKRVIIKIKLDYLLETIYSILNKRMTYHKKRFFKRIFFMFTSDADRNFENILCNNYYLHEKVYNKFNYDSSFYHDYSEKYDFMSKNKEIDYEKDKSFNVNQKHKRLINLSNFPDNNDLCLNKKDSHIEDNENKDNKESYIIEISKSEETLSSVLMKKNIETNIENEEKQKLNQFEKSSLLVIKNKKILHSKLYIKTSKYEINQVKIYNKPKIEKQSYVYYENILNKDMSGCSLIKNESIIDYNNINIYTYNQNIREKIIISSVLLRKILNNKDKQRKLQLFLVEIKKVIEKKKNNQGLIIKKKTHQSSYLITKKSVKKMCFSIELMKKSIKMRKNPENSTSFMFTKVVKNVINLNQMREYIKTHVLQQNNDKPYHLNYSYKYINKKIHQYKTNNLNANQVLLLKTKLFIKPIEYKKSCRLSYKNHINQIKSTIKNKIDSKTRSCIIKQRDLLRNTGLLITKNSKLSSSSIQNSYSHIVYIISINLHGKNEIFNEINSYSHSFLSKLYKNQNENEKINNKYNRSLLSNHIDYKNKYLSIISSTLQFSILKHEKYPLFKEVDNESIITSNINNANEDNRNSSLIDDENEKKQKVRKKYRNTTGYNKQLFMKISKDNNSCSLMGIIHEYIKKFNLIMKINKETKEKYLFHKEISISIDDLNQINNHPIEFNQVQEKSQKNVFYQEKKMIFDEKTNKNKRTIDNSQSIQFENKIKSNQIEEKQKTAKRIKFKISKINKENQLNLNDYDFFKKYNPSTEKYKKKHSQISKIYSNFTWNMNKYALYNRLIKSQIGQFTQVSQLQHDNVDNRSNYHKSNFNNLFKSDVSSPLKEISRLTYNPYMSSEYVNFNINQKQKEEIDLMMNNINEERKVNEYTAGRKKSVDDNNLGLSSSTFTTHRFTIVRPNIDNVKKDIIRDYLEEDLFKKIR